MTTITQSIPSLGSPPLTSDPVNFDTRADTLYGTSLPAVITATNTWSGQANTVAGEVNTNATNAQTAANTATGASAAAVAAVNATQWVSGQAYVTGAVVWSPINYLSYRANTNTSGTTDPSLSGSWVSLNVPIPVSVANGGTGLTALGTARQVLAVNSGATGLEFADAAGGSLLRMTVFTSSGTWTKGTGTNFVRVTVTGGGGGGGGGSTGSSSNYGASGGAGGTAIKFFSTTGITTVTATVGAAGAGAPGSNDSGTAGGNSSFGANGTGNGGSPGTGAGGGITAPGNGGTASSGDINVSGGKGIPTTGSSTSNSNQMPGGVSYWGGSSGSNAAFGSGGTGGAPNGTGFAGGGGIIVVEEYA